LYHTELTLNSVCSH